MPVLNNQQVYRITDLPEAGTVQPDDLVEIVQDGHNKKAEVSAVSAAVENTSPDISGRLPNLVLTPTGVPAGVYGDKHKVPRITVDSKGRITNVTQQAVEINSDDMSGTAPNVLLNNVFPSTHDPDKEYGGPTKTSVIKVDRKGRIRYVNEVPIQFPLPEQVVVGINQKEYGIKPEEFGKTVLFVQTGLPDDIRDDTITIHIFPSWLSGIEVGKAVVIRLHPLMVSNVIVNIGGTKPLRVELFAGELLNIQKTGPNEYIVREIRTVTSYQESRSGYLGRLSLQERNLSFTDAMSSEKSVPYTVPWAANTTEYVTTGQIIAGGPVLKHYTQNKTLYLDGFGHFGVSRRIIVYGMPVTATGGDGVKQVIESDQNVLCYAVVQNDDTPDPDKRLVAFYVNGRSAYYSNDPLYRRRFYQMVWYSTRQNGEALGFQAYPDHLDSFLVCNPIFDQFDPNNQVKLREWRTTGSVFGPSLNGEDYLHVAQLTKTTFILLERGISVQVIGGWPHFVLSGRFFDLRMDSYLVTDPPHVITSRRTAFTAQFAVPLNKISIEIPFRKNDPVNFPGWKYGSLLPEIDYPSAEIQAIAAVPGMLCVFAKATRPGHSWNHMICIMVRYYQKDNDPAPGTTGPTGWPPVVFDTSKSLTSVILSAGYKNVELFNISASTCTVFATFTGYVGDPTIITSVESSAQKRVVSVSIPKDLSVVFVDEHPLPGTQYLCNTGYIAASAFVYRRDGTSTVFRTYTRSGRSLPVSVYEPGVFAQYAHRFGNWRDMPVPGPM